jgi:hypothetical protein
MRRNEPVLSIAPEVGHPGALEVFTTVVKD